MTEIRFFIPGRPAPGGSKNAFAIKKAGIYTGRVAVVDAGGKATKEWRQNVAAAAMVGMKIADCVPLTGAIEVELVFQMPRPKSHFRSGAKWASNAMLKPDAPTCHITRPDLLKLARSTEDSMSRICYLDDGQIVKESLEKEFSDISGCRVVIRDAQ